MHPSELGFRSSSRIDARFEIDAFKFGSSAGPRKSAPSHLDSNMRWLAPWRDP